MTMKHPLEETMRDEPAPDTVVERAAESIKPSAVLAPEAQRSFAARIADDIAATHELMRETRTDVQTFESRMDSRLNSIEVSLESIQEMLTDAALVQTLNHAEVVTQLAEHRKATELAAIRAESAAIRAESAALLS